MIPQVGARAAAFAVDWVVANLFGALLCLPLVYLGVNPGAILVVAAPLAAFSMVFLALLARGDTPGKRWLKLRLAGEGCLICREIRRLGWLLPLSVLPLARLTLASGDTVLWGIAALWIGLNYAVPLVRAAPDFPHNTATGFTVTRA